MTQKNPRAVQGARAVSSFGGDAGSHITIIGHRPILRAPVAARLRLEALLWAFGMEVRHG